MDAQERWPDLYQFLAIYPHQDWPAKSGAREAAIAAVIADYDLGQRQSVVRQWCDWNAHEGSRFDPRAAVNDGFGVELSFAEPVEARIFMNEVYDMLIMSIRKEEKGWKP